MSPPGDRLGPSPRTAADDSGLARRINLVTVFSRLGGYHPAVSRMARMLTRKAGVVGLAMTAWDIWRRIPPRHRKTILRQARKHGPRLPKAAVGYNRPRKR